MHRKVPHHLEKDSSAAITQFADVSASQEWVLANKKQINKSGPLELLHCTAAQ